MKGIEVNNNTFNSFHQIFATYFFILLRLLALIILLAFPDMNYAHEQWFLTPEQMQHLKAEPRPHIFTHFSITNIFILIFSMLCITSWVLLGNRGAREIFPDHQIRLSSYGNTAAIVLRFATALMLLMAVAGLNPRSEVLLFASPTLIFPDLELNLLFGNWMWIKWLEFIIAIGFLLGIYVRLMAALLLGLSILGLYLYGYAMLFYFGVVAGISLYLIFQGPGALYIPLPALLGKTEISQKIDHFFKNQPKGRSQFLLRVLVGLSFAYTGIIYKFLYPNLAIGLLTMRHMITFGLNIETVVFLMAIIETVSGVLLLLGILTRPIALLLFACFVFMSFAVDEPFLSHSIFYGALIACYLNGAGQWRYGPAKDKPANIVILGATLSGIACAKKLERLIGNISNVRITIVHHENYIQYDPLLSEVISGLVQPSNIVSSIHRVCPLEHFIQGDLKSINHKQVEVSLISGASYFIPYDQLIIAYGKAYDDSSIPGFDQYSMPILNLGDALSIRGHILECLEKAELTENEAERRMLLTFAVINGGLRGTSVVAGIKALIQSALICYPKINSDDIKIYLLDKHPEILSSFNQEIAAVIHHELSKMNIIVKTNANLLMLDNQHILLTSGEKIPCYTKISAQSSYSPLNILFQEKTGNLYINERLQVKGIKNIFLASGSACFINQVPFLSLLEVRSGKLAAYNAWANSQGFKLHQWKFKKQFLSIVSLGQNMSAIQFGRLILKGQLAWIISRLICMRVIPSLEVNLRILVDWLFNFPFRKDLVAFTITQTSKTVSQPMDLIDQLYGKRYFPCVQYSRNFAIVRTETGELKLLLGLPLDTSFLEISLLKNSIWHIIAKDFNKSDLIILNDELFATFFIEANLQKYNALTIKVDKPTQKPLEISGLHNDRWV